MNIFLGNLWFFWKLIFFKWKIMKFIMKLWNNIYYFDFFRRKSREIICDWERTRAKRVGRTFRNRKWDFSRHFRTRSSGNRHDRGRFRFCILGLKIPKIFGDTKKLATKIPRIFGKSHKSPKLFFNILPVFCCQIFPSILFFIVTWFFSRCIFVYLQRYG